MHTPAKSAGMLPQRRCEPLSLPSTSGRAARRAAGGAPRAGRRWRSAGQRFVLAAAGQIADRQHPGVAAVHGAGRLGGIHRPDGADARPAQDVGMRFPALAGAPGPVQLQQELQLPARDLGEMGMQGGHAHVAGPECAVCHVECKPPGVAQPMGPDRLVPSRSAASPARRRKSDQPAPDCRSPDAGAGNGNGR